MYLFTFNNNCTFYNNKSNFTIKQIKSAYLLNLQPMYNVLYDADYFNIGFKKPILMQFD